MKNVYNHASRAINRISCALYQCVRVIPVPAWMLKLGTLQAQLQAVSSHSVTCYLGQETNAHLFTASFQVIVESKVSPQPPLLQTKQTQLPQLFLIRPVLQTLHQPCCPSLDTLQHLNALLVLRGPN